MAVQRSGRDAWLTPCFGATSSARRSWLIFTETQLFTEMALTGLERVTKGLDALRRGLGPFVARELATALGSHWEVVALHELPPTHYARTKPKPPDA